MLHKSCDACPGAALLQISTNYLEIIPLAALRVAELKQTPAPALIEAWKMEASAKSNGQHQSLGAPSGTEPDETNKQTERVAY